MVYWALMSKRFLTPDDHLHNLVLVSRVEFESFRSFFQRKAMADQTGQIHPAALGQADGARVGVLHAATHDDRKSLATRCGGLEFQLVATRNANDNQTPAEPRHFRGLSHRFL